MSDDMKREAAKAALAELDMISTEIMHIGLGTGSTAKHFVDLLGERVAQGFNCICVPTSEQTARQAQGLNIPLSDLDHIDSLHITVDGTDEITPDLALIKGAGGALLREKIVASVSDKMVVIADDTKIVTELGAFPLPIEVNRFALMATKSGVQRVLDTINPNGTLVLRKNHDQTPYVTDGGHFILDACFGRISDAKDLSTKLLDIPGVVQHGLFLDLCQTAYIAGPNGITKMGA